MEEKSLFNNGFFEFISRTEHFMIDEKKKVITRNMVRRPPGIRAMILNKKRDKILLSHEFRYELNSFD